MEVLYEFWVPDSYRGDMDNFIKPLQDILQKKLYFKNDSKIWEYTVRRISSVNWRMRITIKPYAFPHK